jgi:hypothetical protein
MSEAPTASIKAHLSRLAGALLLAGDGEYFLIGNTKEPCDWTAAGFEPPVDGDATTLRVRCLKALGNVAQTAPDAFWIQLDEGSSESIETVAEILANRLLIRRNASFSERLWRIVTGAADVCPIDSSTGTDLSWLMIMPEHVWEIVRETALKCL